MGFISRGQEQRHVRHVDAGQGDALDGPQDDETGQGLGKGRRCRSHGEDHQRKGIRPPSAMDVGHLAQGQEKGRCRHQENRHDPAHAVRRDAELAGHDGDGDIDGRRKKRSDKTNQANRVKNPFFRRHIRTSQSQYHTSIITDNQVAGPVDLQKYERIMRWISHFMREHKGTLLNFMVFMDLGLKGKVA